MFTVTPLINAQYLVTGSDITGQSGTVVLESEAWDFVKHMRAHEVADAEFDAAVEEFFAPIVDAATKRASALTRPGNQWATVTFGEDVEGSRARTIELDTAGIILRILEETDGSALRWANGQLVAVA